MGLMTRARVVGNDWQAGYLAMRRTSFITLALTVDDIDGAALDTGCRLLDDSSSRLLSFRYGRGRGGWFLGCFRKCGQGGFRGELCGCLFNGLAASFEEL